MKKVPPSPDQVRLRTGDRVRIEVRSDRPGFLTVFNVGPAGTLNLLYPDGDPQHASPPARIEPNQPLHIVDVEMTPPAGRERLFAVWTRQPLPLRLDQLHSLVERKSGDVSRLPALRRDPRHETRPAVGAAVAAGGLARGGAGAGSCLLTTAVRHRRRLTFSRDNSIDMYPVVMDIADSISDHDALPVRRDHNRQR